jgi:hypothetical protein
MEILELQKGQVVYFDEDETNFLTMNGLLQKVRKTKCPLCQQMGVEMPHNIFLHSIYIGKDYSPTPRHWCNTQTKKLHWVNKKERQKDKWKIKEIVRIYKELKR